jgi:hypothetical protein
MPAHVFRGKWNVEEHSFGRARKRVRGLAKFQGIAIWRNFTQEKA